MPNAYVSLDLVGSTGVLNVGITGADGTRLRQIAETVSRQIDRFTGRTFYAATDTRYFSGDDKTRVLLPFDITAITTLKEDDNGDATYNKTFSSSDYVKWPYDAASTEGKTWSRPITALEINLRSTGSQDVFMSGQKRYEIVGRFGYSEDVQDTGVNIVAATGSSDTRIQVTIASSTKVEIGDTLLVGTEQMYVHARSSSGYYEVNRAVNGTSVSAHSSSAQVNRYVWPSEITEAAMMQTVRLWSRREQAFGENQAGLLETGQVGPTIRGLDLDVRQLINGFVKPRF
jgi:hypothetical protein